MTAHGRIKAREAGSAPDRNPRSRRAAAMLDAAESLFREQGYERTKLGDVIRLSGGSLQTLYQLFENKQGLLHAIAKRWRDETMGRVPKASDTPGSKIEFLQSHAREYARTMRLPRTIALTRMLVSESLRDKDFAQQIHEDLHLGPTRELAALFARWQSAGEADFGDPAAAAAFFQTLVRGDALADALSGSERNLASETDMDARVAFFSAFYRVR